MKDAHEPLASEAPRVYAARWWICGCFSLFCMIQQSIWNFNGPIQDPLEHLYGWTDGWIESLGNLANLVFSILVIPMGIFVARYGTRPAVVIAVFAIWVNAALRCLPDRQPSLYDPASMVAMVFNGLAGTTETLSPPVLSSLWFPLRERAIATAIMASANTLGSAAGFAMAFLVPSDADDDDTLTALHRVYWIYFGLSGFLFLCVLIYFPQAPPTPASHSSHEAHHLDAEQIKSGVKQLMVHGHFWIVVLSFAVPLGIYNGWLNVLDINLKNLDFDQSNAGWIGFGSMVGGTIAGVLSGRIADVFPGRLRQIIIGLYLCAGICFSWFTLTCWKILPFSLISVYISSCAAGFFMFGTFGVFFELAVESTFPISDACTASVLALSQGVLGAVFLTIPVDTAGTNWMNPVLAASPMFAAVVLYFLPDRYERLNMDASGSNKHLDPVV